MSKDLLVYLIRMLDKVIGSVASFQSSSNEVEEANKADFEGIGGRSLQLCEDERKNGVKVWVESGSGEIRTLVSIRLGVVRK